ncbi:hypothetical protein EDC50_1268 [Vulcaniibacterium tengchongense]|uniref:Uncharacterized protein n=1 Tax=Vulcaniibacterium tengchongense TaxID=1273429 RepID=A0A3N4VGA1_9GAMM|nr:hypothetical protein EDC50_1268 [Vulcaniibacterium tengchongense]
MQPHVPALLRVEDLAKRIHKSIASIRSDVCRNPQALPPMCRQPGTKRLLWREEDVNRWLEKHVVSAISSPPPPVTAPRRRGRPTKVEQLARSGRQDRGRA